jgi:hypothetical protein
LLIDLKSYFLGFTVDTLRVTIFQISVSSTNESINTFISAFNAAAVRLKLLEFSPLRPLDVQNELGAHSEDTQNLRSQTIVLLTQNPGFDRSAVLNERLRELQEQASELALFRRRKREQEDDWQRIMTDQEIQEMLQCFSFYFFLHSARILFQMFTMIFKSRRIMLSGSKSSILGISWM